MTEPTRSALTEALEEWGAYAQDFKRLPPDRQAAFLQEQGFAALQDLLGHVIGWWQEGLRLVQGVQADPSFIYDEPDTDEFNAGLVRKHHAMHEGAVLQQFENTRRAMIELVRDLPDDVFSRPLIREWLMADVIEHLEEHRLPG
jgi:hypothetical protein